jgi:uncharacterized RDD family membrane protein YckC
MFLVVVAVVVVAVALVVIVAAVVAVVVVIVVAVVVDYKDGFLEEEFSPLLAFANAVLIFLPNPSGEFGNSDFKIETKWDSNIIVNYYQ